MASATNQHNFDTRDMRTLVTFMSRRFMVKNFVDTGYFTDSEREEFDRLCAEMKVPSSATAILRLQDDEEDDLDFCGEVPALTTSPRPDMSRPAGKEMA